MVSHSPGLAEGKKMVIYPGEKCIDPRGIKVNLRKKKTSYKDATLNIYYDYSSQELENSFQPN